jgi:hypothetical protein
MSRGGKPVHLNGIPIGDAVTWSDVAVTLMRLLDKDFDPILLQQHGSEGPDGFFLSASAALTGFTRVPVS